MCVTVLCVRYTGRKRCCTNQCGRKTPNPNKCTHGFSGFKHKIAIISIPRGVVTENSSDLDSGRRPKLRSVEFFVTTPLVIEIRGRLFVTFPDFVYTYWDSESIIESKYRHT